MDHLRLAKENRLLNNRKYRDWYRTARTREGYNPVFHVSFNFVGLAFLILSHFYFVSDWNWRSALVLLGTMLLGNVFVYCIHRFPLHKRTKLTSFTYVSHTVEHHRYFTSDNITYDDGRDLFVVFFPPLSIVFFALVGQPLLYFTMAYLVGKNLAHVLAGASAGYFMLYEFFHWASHLPADHPLIRNIGWIRYMRTHHIAHHNPKLMNSYNFCIVYPLMDVVMGTKYKGVLPKDNSEDHFQDVRLNFKDPELS
ncbi:MAG TPA: hypothetical protein VNJ01_17340 [Bacteriovoracaceae bacterium]|nr:hypothetical protein [Bacteriovoracaceae bacterium]